MARVRACMLARPWPSVARSASKPVAVVADLQHEVLRFQSEVDLDLGAPGMAHRVVHGFLEDEEDLTALVGVYRHILQLVRERNLSAIVG